MQYVNVGGPWEKPDDNIKVDTWGQVVELPDEVAVSAVRDGAHLLPKPEFDRLGFTADEIGQRSNPRWHHEAPEDFRQKAAAAIDAARAYRVSLEGK